MLEQKYTQRIYDYKKKNNLKQISDGDKELLKKYTPNQLIAIHDFLKGYSFILNNNEE